MESDRKLFGPGLISGLVIVLVGVVLLLDRFGLVNGHLIFRLWPAIFILIGVYTFRQPDKPGKVVSGGLFIMAGAVLLLITFGVFSWSQVWPFCLIVLGLILIWESVASRRALQTGCMPRGSCAIFSSVERSISGGDFQGAQANAVFGSIEMDLSRAGMAGDSAVLDVQLVFGSLELRIPDTWRLAIEVNPVFGSCEDTTRPPLPGNSPKTLVIRGEIVFGSVEVKN